MIEWWRKRDSEDGERATRVESYQSLTKIKLEEDTDD